MTNLIEEIVRQFAHEDRNDFTVAEVIHEADSRAVLPLPISESFVARRLAEMVGALVPVPPTPGVTLTRTGRGRYALEPVTASSLTADDVAATVTGRPARAALQDFAETAAAITASVERMRAALNAVPGGADLPPFPPPAIRPKWYRRFQVYFEPRNVWIGVYVAAEHVYVCPLPMVVIRYRRRGRA